MSIEFIIILGIAYYIVTVALIIVALNLLNKRDKTTIRKKKIHKNQRK